MHIRNAEYNPKRFTGCVIRLREPRVTCLLFSTGKMVATGGRSEESNNLGARKCARVIQKLGFPVRTIGRINAIYRFNLIIFGYRM